jgi:hypothetical protein
VMETESEVWCKEVMLVLKMKLTLGKAFAAL